MRGSCAGAGAAVPVLGSSGALFAGCLLQRDVTVKGNLRVSVNVMVHPV